MDLKLRKRIQNGALPSLDDILAQAGSFSHPSTTSGVIGPADAFKQDVIDANNKFTGDLLSFKRPTVAEGNWKDKFGNVAGVVSNGINFVDTLRDISTNKYTSDEMMGSGGTANQTANGIGYQELSVDSNGIQSQIDATAKAGTMSGISSGAALGGSIGSVIPGVGTAIGTVGGAILGGIFGGLGSSAAKREAERQKMIAINRTNALNTQNREMAYTTWLRNRFARENVTDDTQSLFHAEKGVERVQVDPYTGLTLKNYMVNTAYGPQYGPANVETSKNERIISEDGPSYKVKNGPRDNAKTYLKDGDTVVSADKRIINPATGNPIIVDVEKMAAANGGIFSKEEKDWIDMNQNLGRMLAYTGKRKTNMLPHYYGGTANSFLNRLWNGAKEFANGIDLGNLATLGNAYAIAAQRDARAQGLRSPQSYAANAYEKDALNQLNSLHSNYYPVFAANREIEGRGRASIAQSGGLSAGQRMLGYMGLTNQTQLNNAQAIFEHQNHENALRAQAARASLEAGNQSAVRQQQSYQWDEDMLAKAHAARENMLETSAYDRQNALESFFRNRFKKNQFDRTMNLYESLQKNDEAKTKAIIDSLYNNDNKLSKPTTTQKQQTLADVAKNITTPLGAASLGIAQLPQMPLTFDIASKVKQPEAAITPIRKPTTARTSRKPASKSYTVTNDAMGKQFASVVTKPLKKESEKATKQAKPTEDATTKSTLLSSVLPGGRNLVSLSSNKDIPPYSVAKQEEHKLKSKVGKPIASLFVENVSETVSKAYEDGQKKRKSQLKKQPAKLESKAGKSIASSFLDALSKLYAEGLKRREETLKEQRGY